MSSSNTTLKKGLLMSSTSKERLVGVFGENIIASRNRTIEYLTKVISDSTLRSRLGTLNSGVIEEIARFDESTQLKILQFSHAAINNFIKQILLLFSHRGDDIIIDDKLCARFRIVVEAVSRANGEVIDELVINRDGKKFFADYLGVWINSKSEAEKGSGPFS
jgi:hypothetical protein